jgi:acyl-homoserine lactone synthase
MIHIISASNRHLYKEQLWQMHQLRRVHFVEELGWGDLKVIDGGEYDQFDDERTVYCLALGPDGQVLGGTRARPTDDKSMLHDVFPDLIAPDQPRFCGADIWEMGRTFVTHAARVMQKKTGQRITKDILLGAMEWLQDAGIDQVICITSLDIFNMCRGWGWNIRMTGLPLDTPDGVIVGVEAANTAADVESFRRINGRKGRTAHFVTDADVAAFGSIAAIQAEFAQLHEDTAAPAPRPVDRSA